MFEKSVTFTLTGRLAPESIELEKVMVLMVGAVVSVTSMVMLVAVKFQCCVCTEFCGSDVKKSVVHRDDAVVGGRGVDGDAWFRIQ